MLTKDRVNVLRSSIPLLLWSSPMMR